MEKVWVVNDPDEYLQSENTIRIQPELSHPVEKSPAVAYSLSLLFWGAGQIYNGQKRKGRRFLFLMLLSCIGSVISLLFWKPLFHLLRSYDISCLSIFVAAEVLFFVFTVFWSYNASDAYHTAVRARTTPFTEVPSCVYPVLCSLLIPGWGQHLNGQPSKGSFFACVSIFSIFSVVSIPAALLAWPSLEASETRRTIEGIFTLMALFVPLIPVLWIFGGFDAFKVSIDDLKKEPFLDRIRYAGNRLSTQGLVKGVIPQVRSTIFLLLLLAFLLIVSRHIVPEHFYRDQLADAQIWLQKRGMTITPALIGRLLSGMV
jgi:TM2 domain-containing membrane protein YozV